MTDLLSNQIWIVLFLVAITSIILISWILYIRQFKEYICKHKWFPIKYGLLMRTVDENVKDITNPELLGYIAGGCVVKEERYACSKCGKRIIR